MNKAALFLALTFSFISISPFASVEARGGFGGGFGGGMRGGGFSGFRGGGDFARGGFDRGAGGFDRGGFDRSSFDRSAGGFEHADVGGFHNVENYGAGRFAGSDNYGIGGRPFTSAHLPTDGGFSGIAAERAGVNHVPTTIDSTHLSAQGTSVRNSFNNDNFTKVNVNHYGGYHGYGYGHGVDYHGWGYGYHGWGPGGWYCPGWSQAAAWTFMGVSSLTTFLGIGMMDAALASNGGGAAGVKGNTTNNITYEGDNVYLNGQPAGTAQQFYQQAASLASTATATAPQDSTQPGQTIGVGSTDATTGANAAANSTQVADEKWQALGVFALAEPGQTDSNMLMQIAINQKGILRGNYTNQLTNENSQIYGALDKKTQRISWTIGSNNATVFDTSLSGLVKDDSEVLVHYGPDNTKTMALIRLPAPKGIKDKTS